MTHKIKKERVDPLKESGMELGRRNQHVCVKSKEKVMELEVDKITTHHIQM